MAAVSQPPSSQPPDYPYLTAAWSPTRSQVPSMGNRDRGDGSSNGLSPPLVAMIAVVGTAFLIVVYARLLARPVRRMRSRWRRWRRRRRRMALSPADLDGASPPRNPGGAGDYAYYYYYNSSGGSSNHFLYSPYGLDEAAIKALPVSMFSNGATTGGGKKQQQAQQQRECAVCLLEFEEGDSVRTLPMCSHMFHADCIDVWLRSHANCPLCRAAIFQSQQQQATFAPMRAARIRPSFDDFLLNPPPLMPPPAEHQEASITESPDRGRQLQQQQEPEIVAVTEPSPPRMSEGRGSDEEDDDEYEERRGGNLLLLSRSYSFGFERNPGGGGGDHRMGSPSAATTPWRYPRGGGSRSSFWSKRWPSPFTGGSGGGGGGGGGLVEDGGGGERLGSASAPRPTTGGGGRVFSFRSYLGVGSYLRSSPFFHRGRRSGSSFLPLSESRAAVGNPTSGGPSSRRTQSMTMLSSPAAFLPPAGASSRGGWGWGGPASSSSRHGCGDPAALLSPDRLNSSSGLGGNGR